MATTGTTTKQSDPTPVTPDPTTAARVQMNFHDHSQLNEAESPSDTLPLF